MANVEKHFGTYGLFIEISPSNALCRIFSQLRKLHAPKLCRGKYQHSRPGSDCLPSSMIALYIIAKVHRFELRSALYALYADTNPRTAPTS